MEKGTLCLTRKLGESVMIGDNVEVKIYDAKNGIVSLLVCAPKCLQVHRREIWEDIKNGVEQKDKIV